MKLVIIGNGVAGVTVARHVAERAPAIEIVIYSGESYPYYPRPRLIDLLAGRVSLDELALYPPEWYESHRIRTVLGTSVTEVRPDAHEILLADGASDQYGKLVLATGASPWVPPIPGVDLEHVHVLRTVADALALRDRAQQSKRAVVLGGGLLGLDTAAALCARGIEVCTIEALPRLLPKQLDPEGAEVLGKIIASKGVQFIAGDVCARLEGEGRVERVYLKSGRVIETDLVVVSTGIRSNTQLAAAACLACQRGITVNDRLQTTHPDIYAVGDAAEFHQRVWGIIPAAVAQARVAAAQIVGDTGVVYEDIVPSTTLKVTGVDLTSIGVVNPQEEAGAAGFSEVRYTNAEAGVYKKLVLRDGRVVGAIVLSDRSDLRAINQLIAQQVDVSAHAHMLLSEGFDLMSLVRGQAPT